MNFLHNHSINSCLNVRRSTVEDQGVLLAYSHCYDALPDIEEAGLIFIFERLSPASEEATFWRRLFVSAGSERRFMYF